MTNVPMKRDVVVRDIPDAENLLREFPMAAVVAAPDSIWEHCPNGALVVLDEVWRFWPAGKKVDKIPEAWKSFLAEHGHRVDAAGNAMQVVLITQDLAQIAAFARQLVEQTFRTIKLSSIGFHKKFRTDIYGGPVQGLIRPRRRGCAPDFRDVRPEGLSVLHFPHVERSGRGRRQREGD